jgi:hypothetical protein
MKNLEENKERETLQMYKDNGFTYNKETGEIKGPSGRIINRKHNQGYIRCSLRISPSKKIDVLAHRLAWFLETNQIPFQIDHINMDKTDNRLCNLRDVSDRQNKYNLKCKGYYWNEKRNHWVASIKVEGKQKYLGTFAKDNEIGARNAYLLAKETYHKYV